MDALKGYKVAVGVVSVAVVARAIYCFETGAAILMSGGSVGLGIIASFAFGALLFGGVFALYSHSKSNEV